MQNRTKIVATGLLIVMGGLFLGAAYFEPRFPALGSLKAFAEAGLAGGLADWFAVTALFRHPLGVPLPHTALIPRNQRRLGVELGHFVERNFFTAEHVADRLRQLDPAAYLCRWLERPDNAASVAVAARQLLTRIIDQLDENDLDRSLAGLAADWLRRLDFPDLLADLLRFLAEDDRVAPLLNAGAPALRHWLDENRPNLSEKLGERSRYTPRFVDAYIVNRFVDAVTDLLAQAVSTPDHELRKAFTAGLVSFADRLNHDAALRHEIAALKDTMIDRFEVEETVTGLWGRVKLRLLSDDGASLEHRLTDALVKLARSTQHDDVLKDRLNKTAIGWVEAGLSRFGHQLATMIAEIVSRWQSKDIVEKIERGIGRDLQYIRINGTLVGGAVGLLLYGLLLLLQR